MTKSTDPVQESNYKSSNLPDGLLDELVNFLPDAIIIMNEAAQIQYFNTSAEEIFGYKASEVINQKLDILIPENTIKTHQEHFENFQKTERATLQMGQNRIVHGRHQSGYLIPLEIFFTSKKYHNQNFIICVPRNASTQLAFAQTLNESEQRYRGMIDSQNTLVVRLDRESHIVFANQAYCKMFGKNLNELVGKSFTPLVHPDDLPKTLEALKCLEIPPYHSRVEERAMTSTGWRWLAWENSVIRDSSDGIAEIQGIGVDITDHKNIEEELSNKISLLSALLNSIPDIVFFKDTQGKYLGCNHEFARFINKPVDEIVNKTDYDLFDKESADYFRENDQQMLIQGQQRHNEEWITYPDGKKVLLDTLKAPMLDLQGRSMGIIGISRDITLRKQFEEIAIDERNLAIILAQKATVTDSLPIVLDLALRVSGMDCGGIYLVDQFSGDLILKINKGLSEEFVSRASRFSVNSPQYNLVMNGAPIYQPYLQIPGSSNPIAFKEGLHISAIIPVKFNNNVIACLNVASHSLDVLPDYYRNALENFSFQIGNMISRFQAQDELAENQDQLQSMFDSLQDYVFVLDQQGSILQVNQMVLSGLGYSRNELIGADVLMVHPPEQHILARKIVQDMEEGLVNTCHLDLVKKEGTLIPVETKVVRSRWGNREVLIGVSRDITERNLAENARIEQNKLLEYRQKFDEILTAISTRFINLPSTEINTEVDHVLQQIGDFEQVDHSYVFLINRDSDTLTNTNEWCAPGVESQIHNLKNLPTNIFPWWMGKLEKLTEVHIPIVSELPDEAVSERKLLEQQSIQSVLVVPLAIHNSLIGFLGFDTVSKPRFWSQDSILLIKMVGDILSNALTQIKMLNDLKQSESRKVALLSAVPDMIFRIRRDGIFLDFKASSTELLAIPPDQIVGASISSILPESVVIDSLICINNALQTQQIQTMEYTIQIGDASHVFEARFKDSGPDEVTAIVREISERARLEQMKSDFINRATHELRTPIATMLLMVNLIDGDATPEEYKEYWDVMKSELNRERLLVEDLLSAGRLESNQAKLHFRFIDCSVILKQAIHQMEQPAREKYILFSLQLPDDLDETSYIISADENALTQVFINLIGNAIKFTPSGGSVNISLKRIRSGVEISITDTGIGIPSEDIHLLFNRFFRGTNAIQDEIPGTGIGLFIVRSILEKHGGTIKVHSVLNKGSTFDVWLPIHQ